MWFQGSVLTGDPNCIHLYGEMSHRLLADRKTWTPLGEAHVFLKKLSRWKGAAGKCQSARGVWWEYEIPETKLPAIVKVLTLLLGAPTLRRNALSPIEDAISPSMRELMQEML